MYIGSPFREVACREVAEELSRRVAYLRFRILLLIITIIMIIIIIIIMIMIIINMLLIRI